MTIFKKTTTAFAAIFMAAAFAAPAFATDTTPAVEPVCPLTEKVKRTVEYCAAKGLVPGTVYGCVKPRTQQQVTCSAPAPYVAPVQTYIAPVARTVYTVDRCDDGTAPVRDPRDGVHKCAPTAYQVAPARVVTPRVVQPATPAPTYAAYNAPAPKKACTYCNMEFAEMSDTVVPTNRYSSDDRYQTTGGIIEEGIDAAKTVWSVDRLTSAYKFGVKAKSDRLALLQQQQPVTGAVDSGILGHTSTGTMPGLNDSGTLGAASNGATGVVADPLGEDAFLVGNGGYANATSGAVHVGPAPGQFNGVGSIMVEPSTSNGPTLGQWTTDE